MNIDVYMGGQFYHRWQIDDLKNFTIEGATFEENVQAKEQLVRMYYNQFLRHTLPLLRSIKNVEVFVSFESKMNSWPVEDDEEIEPGLYSDDVNFITEI